MGLATASLLLAAALLPQDPRAGKPAAPPDGNKLVRVELLADRTAIHAGEHFTLAAKLAVQRNWHIYWGENPGDSGVPTRLELEGPKGFVIGAPRFPVPLRHVDAGDIVMYVHEGEVLVLFDVEAPAALAADAKSEFALDASWLVCIRECYEGAGSAALTLKTSAGSAPEKANDALFEKARAALPRKLDGLQGLDAQFAIDVQKREDLRLVLGVAGAQELSFFPAEQAEPALVSSASGAEGRLELVYRWKELPKGDQKIGFPGILNVKTKDGTASFWFDRKFFAGYGN